jgi:arginyl-tRNA synthetase
MLNIAKYLSDIISEAVQDHIPDIKEKFMINSEKDKEWQYATPTAIKIWNMVKKKGGLGCENCKDLAQKISECIPIGEVIEKVELTKAGNGPDDKSGFFINIYLKIEFLTGKLKDMAINDIKYETEVKQKVVVDFSSPNIAKNMHVGHLRSTIIGDSLCRILEFMGYDVQRCNHIGDWGTQFGMLISHMGDTFPDFLDSAPNISDLDGFYKEAKNRFDNEEEFKVRSRETVVRLQSGGEKELEAWRMICEVSRQQFNSLYARLDIINNEFGESFYNDMIPPLVDKLEKEGIIIEDQGAKCIFIPKIKVPLIMVKSDGGFNYDSTDMAAMQYRVNEQKADRIIVLTDMGQGFHFKQIEGACKIAGILDPKKHKFDHMGFGLVLDENGEKIKSRSGESIQLLSLLDEARQRAVEVCKGKHAHSEEQKLTEEEYQVMGEIIGITSIKYYDLKQNRTSNYKFGFDSILDPKGETGVYLLYMYVRLCSILRKGNYDEESLRTLAESTEVLLETDEEKSLALLLLRLPEYVDNVFNDLQINKICNMLYDISVKIGEFYHKNKVLGDEKESSRILLIELTRKTMKTLFNMLGMKTIDKI